MIMSNVDGKVINALKKTSSAICFISECNPINMKKKKIDKMHAF